MEAVKIYLHEDIKDDYRAIMISILDYACKYVSSMSKFGLAISDINYAYVMPYPLGGFERQPPDLDMSNLNKPLLSEFETGLVSIHLERKNANEGKGLRIEFVWKTGSSMKKFSRVLNMGCDFELGHEQFITHRSLDQSN